jgi:protein-S-isoprenylcysteine O-methyltransferase Ste14
VLCSYLVVGAVLEERKLKALFGVQYEDYQRRVSMFFPFKWMIRVLGGRR